MVCTSFHVIFVLASRTFLVLHKFGILLVYHSVPLKLFLEFVFGNVITSFMWAFTFSFAYVVLSFLVACSHVYCFEHAITKINVYVRLLLFKHNTSYQSVYFTLFVFKHNTSYQSVYLQPPTLSILFSNVLRH
jgi:hypothetical protein